nr:hypothetical protein [Tanacetum cinerariifolium]
RGPIGLESCATWDRDSITWEGWDKGVGTVPMGASVRECRGSPFHPSSIRWVVEIQFSAATLVIYVYFLRGLDLDDSSMVIEACFKVYAGDIYGDHVVSCASIIGIKHRHNIVRDTLVDIFYWSGIPTGKEIDIGLEEGCDKPLRPTDMLLYSRDGGLICVWI